MVAKEINAYFGKILVAMATNTTEELMLCHDTTLVHKLQQT